jgi:uncharacterized protein (DUF433 family)
MGIPCELWQKIWDDCDPSLKKTIRGILIQDRRVMACDQLVPDGPNWWLALKGEALMDSDTAAPLVTTETMPLRRDADGVIRVGSSRISLDNVVAAFQEGATAEEIAQQYSSLPLADIYYVIGYYLRRQAEVDEYLDQRRKQADLVRRQNEARADPVGIRNRLLARRANQERWPMRWAADENLNNNIIRGLLLQKPDVDIVRVQDVGLSGADDPMVLEWAAEEGRVLLTHDVATITHYAYERVQSGQRMPGVFEVNRSIPLRVVIQDLILLTECSLENEWDGQVRYLPLR